MRAIVQDRYGAADVLELRDIDPPAIGADEVLVEVHAAGVDPGVWVFMTGRPYLVRAASGLRRPRVPVRGRDLAGVVTAVGARVTGVCSGAKAELVRSLGAVDIIDYTRAEVDRDGARYDVVIDTAGCRPLLLLRRALTRRGTLVLVGGGHDAGGLLGGYRRQLRAPLVYAFMSQRLRNLAAREGAEHLTELRKLIESGAVTPVVDRSFSLAEAPEAIRDLAGGHATGKIVITVR